MANKSSKKKVKKAYTPRQKKMPIVVLADLYANVSQTEFVSALSFREGYASADHFNNLCDARDLLWFGAEKRNDKDSIDVADLAGEALMAIRDKHDKNGGYEASTAENAMLSMLVTQSRDFWMRQTRELYAECFDRLRMEREKNAGS